MKDEVKFKEYMTMLGEVFDRPVSPLLITVYWKVLEPFGDEDCERAFREILYTARFFPKPAEFVELLRGRKTDLAVLAWGQVVEAVRRIGPYESVNFGDPVIHAVLEFMGGWAETAAWKEDELKWKQREFERLYAILEGREGKALDHLPGLHELSNRLHGHECGQRVVRIGGAVEERKRIAMG